MAVWVTETVSDSVTVKVSVIVGELVGVPAYDVSVGDTVCVLETVNVAVAVPVGVCVLVNEGVLVCVAVFDGDAVDV